MNREIDSKLEGLMVAMVLAREEEQAKKFVQYGERIVECVQQGDYDEARFVTAAFKSAQIEFWRGKLTLAMKNYIEKTCQLIGSLP